MAIDIPVYGFDKTETNTLKQFEKDGHDCAYRAIQEKIADVDELRVRGFDEHHLSASGGDIRDIQQQRWNRGFDAGIIKANLEMRVEQPNNGEMSALF